MKKGYSFEVLPSWLQDKMDGKGLGEVIQISGTIFCEWSMVNVGMVNLWTNTHQEFNLSMVK